MITSGWHYIKLHVDEWPLVEVECKLDLTHSAERGWFVAAIIADGQRIEMDGSRKRRDGTVVVTKLGQAIAEEVPRYFDEHRDEILSDENLIESEAA